MAAIPDKTAASISLDEALRGAVARGLLQGAQTIDDYPLGFFYDLDAFDANLAHVRATFPPHWTHAVAIKTNPLAKTLQRARDAGHGAECATISEVVHALSLGFEPRNIVFDSPCKTVADIRFCLQQGLNLNIDNLQELERVRAVVEELGDARPSARGVIGLRINPLVGAGRVSTLSVSTRKSKFGCPAPPEAGAERQAIVEAIAGAEFITAVHVHTGSGGMGLAQMVAGCKQAVTVALEANALRKGAKIDTIDIGGGLPVTWGRNPQSPTFEEYAAAIAKEVPELTDASVFPRVFSEFGAALNCKFAFCASVVEVTKGNGDGGQIAMIHAGSDLFARQCYAPHMRGGHPIRVYHGDGTVKSESGDFPVVSHDIAGPLCFAGDIVAPNVELPRLVPGDIVLLEEAGGNTLSIATSHCSRRRPPVYGYTRGQEDGRDDGLAFEVLSAGLSYAQTLSVWAAPAAEAQA